MAKNSSNDGGILHFGAVRYRVTGSGNLKTFLRSLDNVKNKQLSNTVMAAINDIEPTRWANFTNQRAQIEFKTTEINEVFNISKIIVFVKPVATSYPQ